MKKGSHFLEPTLNDPFFQRNLTPNAPHCRPPVGTCKLFSYSSAPPPFPECGPLLENSRPMFSSAYLQQDSIYRMFCDVNLMIHVF